MNEWIMRIFEVEMFDLMNSNWIWIELSVKYEYTFLLNEWIKKWLFCEEKG